MHAKSLIFVAVTFYSFYLSACKEDDEETMIRGPGQLVKAILLYRHGDRTPSIVIPKSNYSDESVWPVGFGQLTNQGKMRQFQLGRWFRKRYSKFLPEKYSEKDIYVRSTDVDRTLMSAASNLAGLYPPEVDQTWNEQLPWQPIPIHTIPETDDRVLAMKKPCPRYDDHFQDLLKTKEFIDMEDQLKWMYRLISNRTGFNVSNLNDLDNVYATWEIEESHNFPHPDWIHDIFPEKMKKWAELRFAVESYNKDLARLKTGPLINEIAELLVNGSIDFENEKTFPKIHMYSAHDTTVGNLLQSMDLFDLQRPGFASTVLIEMYFKEIFFVQILFKNSTQEVHVLTLNGCTEFCPLDRFVDLLDPVRIKPDRWEAECEVKPIRSIPKRSNHNTVIVACGAIFLLLVIIGGFTACFACKRLQSANCVQLSKPNNYQHVQ